MYFQNAVAAYMNRLRELDNGDEHTSERFLDIMKYCCRKHVAEAGGTYLSVVNAVIQTAAEKHKARFC